MMNLVGVIAAVGSSVYIGFGEELYENRRKRIIVSVAIFMLILLGHILAIEWLGYGFSYFIYLGIGCILALLAVNDLINYELPIDLLAVGYFFVIGITFYRRQEGYLTNLIIAGVVLVFMVFLSRILKGGIGEGDAHVMAVLIVGVGWKHGLVVFMGALLLTAIMGIVLMVFRGKSRKTVLPFVPFIAVVHFGLLIQGVL